MLPRLVVRPLILSAALLVGALAPGHATAAADGARAELAQLFGRTPADVDDGQESGRGPDAAGLSVRVDHLESELRSFTGQLEQAQFQVRRLEDQLKKFQQDVDFRLQDLGRGGGGAGRAPTAKRSDLDPAQGSIPAGPGATTPSSVAPLATAGMRRGDAFDPDSDPNAPGAPRQLGSLSSSATALPPVVGRRGREEGAPMDQGFEDRDPNQPVDLMRRPARAASAGPAPLASNSAPLVPIPQPAPVAAPARAAGSLPSAAPPTVPSGPAGAPRVIPLTPAPAAAAPPGTSVAALAPPATPKAEYEEAVGYLKQGQYDAAEKGFSDFLAKNPKNSLAASAVYNLGESYFLRARHREAAEQFLKISTTFPASARAPDAMLRLGQSLNAIGGAKEQACAAFGEVKNKYPNAAASVRAAAEREAKKNQC